MIHDSQNIIDPPQLGVLQTVLVADPDEEVRSLVREVLEEQRFAVVEARDEQEALAGVSRVGIDLIIIDLVLNAWEERGAIQMLKERHPGAKVLAISGAFGGSVLRCGRRLGADAVLKKPFSCKLLINTVRHLLVPVGGR